MMPKQKPGRSKQDYGTPKDFLSAVEVRFGPLTWDLAASAKNAKAPNYFTEQDDSLKQDWTLLQGNLWLNPPFANIASWARKCADEVRRWNRILFLVPASVGSNWFADHVWGKARVFALQGRLTFEGETAPYPKDCMLCVYGLEPGFEVWKWK